MLKKMMATGLILSGLIIVIGCGKAPTPPAIQPQTPAQTQETTAPDWTGWGPEEKGLRCRVSCDKNIYAPNDPIMVTCRVANLSIEEIMLGGVKGGYINVVRPDFSVDFILTDSWNKKVAGENRTVDNDQLKTGLIKPGQNAEIITVDLRYWYKELPAGTYTLQSVCLRRHMEAASEDVKWVSNELLITIRN